MASGVFGCGTSLQQHAVGGAGVHELAAVEHAIVVLIEACDERLRHSVAMGDRSKSQ